LQRNGLLNDESVVLESEVGQLPGARLTVDEREEIALGVATGRSFANIAVQLWRPTSTVSREVDRNGGRSHYRASRAQRETDRRARRPKVRRLVEHRWLAAEVASRLNKKHSPEQIANQLRLEHPDEPHRWVSHETIYQALYLQGRGGLKAELTEALRTGRVRRRPKSPNPGRGARGKPTDAVLISERSAEAPDRAVPGHWEGDLILERAGKSQIATIVERTTQYLPRRRDFSTVTDTQLDAIAAELNERSRETLGWMTPSEKFSELVAAAA
jgi:transposase, IS30 family